MEPHKASDEARSVRWGLGYVISAVQPICADAIDRYGPRRLADESGYALATIRSARSGYLSARIVDRLTPLLGETWRERVIAAGRSASPPSYDDY